MSKQFMDWVIHLVSNGAECCECGEKETSFFPYACNAHTHGMDRYNHLDFQLVLKYPKEEVMRILNTLGLRVKAGERFQAGDFVTGIYEDCAVRLDEIEENGRNVLRVIIPDKYGRFPEDEACIGAYLLQLLKTDDLTMKLEDRNPIVRVYQMKNEEGNRNLIFENLEQVQKITGGRIPAELYECVYEGKPNIKEPEDAFILFNTEFADGYKGRSMSVSDVVEFQCSDTQDFFFYCDSVGFHQIHFKTKEPTGVIS